MDMQNIETQLEELKAQVEAISKKTAENKLAMVVFSGDMDKVLAAFVIATGAVAMGMEVVMFLLSGEHRSSETRKRKLAVKI